MKPIALPLLVVTLGSLGSSARATEPDLTELVFETGLISLGPRDSLIVHAKETKSGKTNLTVEFFDAEEDLLLAPPTELVIARDPASISLSYSQTGSNAPFATVSARISVDQEIGPGDLPWPSLLSITIEHANQATVLSSTAKGEGGCRLTAGPPNSGGGRDSKCFGTLFLVNDDEESPVLPPQYGGQ